ncbi:MAG: hypothetical protein Q4P32_04120 [Micrococcales bacterium]|nr:hypothetical protein [Micrococcales bacterium]
MIPRTPLPQALVRLAEAQSGVLSRAQIRSAGVGATVTARWSREWLRLAPGIYLATASGPGTVPPWPARLWAGILMGEGGPHCKAPYSPARIGGLAAAVVQGLADSSDEPAPPGRATRFTFGPALDIDVHVDPARRAVGAVGYRFVRSSRSDSCERGIAPCTPVAQTVLDLCDLTNRADAIAWVDRACQRRATTPAALVEALDGRPRARHRRALLAVLQGHVEGATSELERLYRRDVEQAHGLPVATRQLRAGTRLLDNRYSPYGIIVELDGLVGHVGPGRFRDWRRDNVHTVAGQKSLRYGWEDCFGEPCEVAAEVALLLRVQGWPGMPVFCPRCPPDVFSARRIDAPR